MSVPRGGSLAPVPPFPGQGPHPVPRGDRTDTHEECADTELLLYIQKEVVNVRTMEDTASGKKMYSLTSDLLTNYFVYNK